MPLSKDQRAYLQTLDKNRGHGRNMLGKANKPDIERFYAPYMAFSEAMEGGLHAAVNGLNAYKDFVSEHSEFSSQSKFAPTIIEEFLCLLLQDRFGNDVLRYGSIKAYSSLYFSYSGTEDFKQGAHLRINVKDQDVSIFKEEVITTTDGTAHKIFIPLVCIECKTYLDKTMYEGSVATAAKIKSGNPHCLFIIVTETYEIASNVDVSSSQIDNIYVLRKRRRRRDIPIQEDVVQSLLARIERHLTDERLPVDEMIRQRGYLLE